MKNLPLACVTICIGTFALSACHHKEKNPLLRDIKASTNIVKQVGVEQSGAFDAVKFGADYKDCYTSKKWRTLTYGNSVKRFDHVCQQFYKGVLSKAHQNDTFKSASIQDVTSVRFYHALLDQLQNL